MMKVLIAEDDFTSRSMLTAVLQKGGHEVLETTMAWKHGGVAEARLPVLVILD